MTLNYDVELLDELCRKTRDVAFTVEDRHDIPRYMKGAIWSMIGSIASMREQIEYWKENRTCKTKSDLV